MLNTLRQEPYEKVDFYAEKFKRLIKKVNSSNALSDKYTVRIFLNGLRKNIISLIAFIHPKNVDEAIKAAKQVERKPDRRKPKDDRNLTKVWDIKNKENSVYLTFAFKEEFEPNPTVFLAETSKENIWKIKDDI
ncbi:12720_t:CDS:2 [Funneliformis caledonium]|uniref:12720_t:CDS:1 n=1 Tax=Funneliformis caledonium TaxID=1117310 RepID=A0A9N9DFK3_9GLOM|nr:12720_t:CDS:2 [Funneliformis caledonium]